MLAVQGQKQAKPRAVWEVGSTETYSSLPEARRAADQLEYGKWKWRPQSRGNGKTTGYFVCNAHKDCGREMRISQSSGCFSIHLTGKHTSEPTMGPRSNSILSWSEETRLKRALDEGARPAEVRVSMTKDRMQELTSLGLNPYDYKDPNGGVTGEHGRRSIQCKHLYPIISASYSRVYLALSTIILRRRE